MKSLKNTKLVIFDFDGTILNTIEDLADAVNHALSVFSMPERTLAEVTAFVGNGMKNLIIRSVPDGTSSSVTENVLAEFMTYYKLHSADKTKAYDGIYALLDKLKSNGFLLAVASNKADSAIQDLCSRYFSGYFDLQSGEQKNIPKKPEPDLIYYICSQLNVLPEDSVLIGDSEVDVQTAINAGIPCIAAEWGFRNRQILIDSGAEIIVTKPEEIIDILTE